MGLRGGDRLGIVEGQQIVVGGDILLSVQEMLVTSNGEMVKVIKMLETLKAGDKLRVKVVRDGTAVELSMKRSGWQSAGSSARQSSGHLGEEGDIMASADLVAYLKS